MGYAARLAFRDAAGAAWRGQLRVDLPALRGVLAGLPNLDPALLGEDLGAAAAWADVLPAGVALQGVLRPAVVRLRLPAGGPLADVVLKLVRPSPDRGPLGWLRRLEGSRAQRAHLAAHRLLALGIPVPRPLGYVERARRPRHHPAYVAYEYVPGPTLLELAPTLVGSGHRTQRRALLGQVAELYRRLHEQGIFHADLHAGNLLVTPDAVVPIDLVSLRRWSFRDRAVLKNLARLNRDFLDRSALSSTDRLRFLRAYLRYQAEPRTRAKALFRSVLGETEAKLKRYGGAFSSPPTSAYDALDVPTLPVPPLVRPDDPAGPAGDGGA